MTQKKLEIIGPYSPDHPGPFCTRDGRPVELKFCDGRGDAPICGYIGDDNVPARWEVNGKYFCVHGLRVNDLMNAREVPVAREFWLSEYRDGVVVMNRSKDHAEYASRTVLGVIRTIHVREVLPGDGE